MLLANEMYFNTATKNLCRTAVRFYGTAGDFMPQTADDTSLRDQALQKLKNRLRSYTGQYKGLVPLAEIRDLRRSIAGLYDFSSKGARLLERVLKGRTLIRDGRLVLRYTPDKTALNKQLSEWWLGFSFGLTPMVRDIADLIQSIENFKNNRCEESERFTAKAEKTWSSVSKATTTGTNYSNIQVVKSIQHTLSYRYIAGFDVTILTGNCYSINDHFGLSAANIPGTLWELAPYSWLIDYLTNIGAYLDDTWEFPPSSSKYLVLNKRYTCHVVLDPYLDTQLPVVKTGQIPSPGYIDYYNFTRTKLAALPKVGIHFNYADQVAKYAPTKLLNLLACLRVGWK